MINHSPSPSLKNIDARLRAARSERSRTVASYVANLHFFRRVLDALNSDGAPVNSR